jgi:hypothetical protein
MYLSAYIDKSFSGRGFISPPALGWVERQPSDALLRDFNVSSALPHWDGLKAQKRLVPVCHARYVNAA